MSDEQTECDQRNEAASNRALAQNTDTYRAAMAHRRRQVAAMRIRGYTVDEIVSGLVELGVVDETNGTNWSRGVVYKDMQWAASQWLKDAQQSQAVHRAKLLAQNDELRRRLWQGMGGKKGIDNQCAANIIKTNEFEAKLYGLNAPEKIIFDDVSNDAKQKEVNQIVDNMTPEDRKVFMRMRDEMRTKLRNTREPITIDAPSVIAKKRREENGG